jgi:hypothetical protein
VRVAARVVDEDVEAAEALHVGVDHPGALRRFGDVGGQGQHPVGVVAREGLLELVRAAARPRPREQPLSRKARAMARPIPLPPPVTSTVPPSKA